MNKLCKEWVNNNGALVWFNINGCLFDSFLGRQVFPRVLIYLTAHLVIISSSHLSISSCHSASWQQNLTLSRNRTPPPPKNPLLCSSLHWTRFLTRLLPRVPWRASINWWNTHTQTQTHEWRQTPNPPPPPFSSPVSASPSIIICLLPRIGPSKPFSFLVFISYFLSFFCSLSISSHSAKSLNRK